ncbi:MAG: 16S rRNA (adenine(1518)-N(6)/adenine(1519)-N(6))-dimethyltransferase RsmA [Longimicrobiales bacterium]
MSKPGRARKSLGQNFLLDPNIQRKIVAALDPQPMDTVIEIGPGLGALTSHLVGRVKRLIAIELDDRLATSLQQEYQGRTDFTLLHQDVMQCDFKTLAPAGDYKVIGNIPYNITTPLLFRLLQPSARPRVLVLMLQKEVAQRITTGPGSKEYGALSVGVQSVARAERLFNVSRSAFRPVPGVDSTVLRITPMQPPPLQAEEEADMRTLTRTLFGQRRKQMQSVLRHAPEYQLSAADVKDLETGTHIDLNARPEALAPEQFIALSRSLRNAGRPLRSAA